MEYTPDQLQLIRDKKPELKLLVIPSLDAVIVEFLKRFEVFVQPITSGTKNYGEAAVAGAITGMAGADVGGDAFMISGQNKQTKVQEWTQWKQWALDHKDFESFRSEKIDKPKAHYLEILNKPEIQKELEELFKEPEEWQDSEGDEFFKGIILIAMAIVIIVIPVIVLIRDSDNNNSSFNSTLKNEKIREIFS